MQQIMSKDISCAKISLVTSERHEMWKSDRRLSSYPGVGAQRMKLIATKSLSVEFVHYNCALAALYIQRS